MSSTYQVKQPNIVGRIGTGIGQGLAEQVPKEIERHRLSSGLKKLGQEDLSKMSRLEQLGHIYNVPGITPEIAAAAQKQIQNQAFTQRNQGSQAAQGGSAQPQSQPQRRGAPSTEPQGRGGFASPSEIKRAKESLQQEPSPQEINSLASDFLRDNLAEDFPTAQKMAAQEIQQRISAQTQKSSAFDNDFNERAKLELQGTGLGDFKDVTGEIQNSLLDQGRYLVNAKGVSPKVASEEMSEIMKELGKTSNKTRQTGNNVWRPSAEKDRELRAQKKNYEKYGFGEQFDDLATASLGITPMKAAQVLDPIKSEKLKAGLEGLKAGKHTPAGIIASNVDNKALDKVIKEITPEDNLLHAAYILRKNHVNINQFFSRVSELADEGKIAITPKQQRQLERKINNSFMGDILYETL